jgi:chromate transport protein ChrA
LELAALLVQVVVEMVARVVLLQLLRHFSQVPQEASVVRGVLVVLELEETVVQVVQDFYMLGEKGLLEQLHQLTEVAVVVEVLVLQVMETMPQLVETVPLQ